MLEFNDKAKIRKKAVFAAGVFFLLLILTFILLRASLNVYWKRAESIDNLAKVNEQASALHSRQAELSENISKLQTQSGVETEIRKKFSVVKDGEQMVVLVDDRNKPAPPPPPQPGFFKRMWNSIASFFGHNSATSTVASQTIMASSTH